MDLGQVEAALYEIFGSKNVKPHASGFRVIIDYDNMPYCIVLRLEQNKLIMDRDAVDREEANYEEAYKKAYKMLIQNKSRFDFDVVI